MNTATVTAASGLRARMQELDMLANNLANSSTGGYKLDREFYSLFSAANNDVEGEPSETTLPEIKSQWTDFSQGSLTPTGNPMDLALSGPGFFTVQGQSGLLFTRDGSFRVSPANTLITNDGHALLSVAGNPIQIPGQGPVLVAPDGSVTQDGSDLGTLKIVDFKDRSALVKTGDNYFTTDEKKNPPAGATNVTVSQGLIENSNVAPAESTVRLVGVMRQFEMLSKAISLTNDMDNRTLTEVAKVVPSV